jgi:hypothetical protein
MRKKRIQIKANEIQSAGTWRTIRHNPDTGYVQVERKDSETTSTKIWIPEQWLNDFARLQHDVNYYRQSQAYYKRMADERGNLGQDMVSHRANFWKAVAMFAFSLSVVIALVASLL